VSVDGRYTTAYPDHVLDEADRFQSGAPNWERTLDSADIALVDRRQPVLRTMFERRDWRYVYSDATALVFIRAKLPLPVNWNRDTRDGSDDVFFFP
jgi:hypothetical protein